MKQTIVLILFALTFMSMADFKGITVGEDTVYFGSVVDGQWDKFGTADSVEELEEIGSIVYYFTESGFGVVR